MKRILIISLICFFGLPFTPWWMLWVVLGVCGWFATNPKEADQGTIRAEHAESIEANSVHGSDSPENAIIEINFFFDEKEIVG